MTAQQCAERQAARDNLVHELTSALRELISAINYRSAVVVSDDSAHLLYADERMWRSVDVAHAALARAKEQA